MHRSAQRGDLRISGEQPWAPEPLDDWRRGPISYYDWFDVEIHESARKHGVGDDDIVHAVEHAVAVYDIGEGDDEPIRSLHLGPDRAGNPLEMVVLELDDGRWLVIHAMRIRRRYQGLLTDNRGGEDERSG